MYRGRNPSKERTMKQNRFLMKGALAAALLAALTVAAVLAGCGSTQSATGEGPYTIVKTGKEEYSAELNGVRYIFHTSSKKEAQMMMEFIAGEAAREAAAIAAFLSGPANPDSDWDYELDSTGKGVKLKGYKGTSNFVTFPETIEGLPVTSMMPLSGKWKTNSLAVKQGWTSDSFPAARIQGLAFSSKNTPKDIDGIWPNLQILILPFPVNIGNAVHSPGFGGEHSNYPNLKHIVMRDSVTENGNYQGLPSLETVVFSNSMTSVSGFADCPKLSKVTLPRNLQEIRTVRDTSGYGSNIGAFENCVSLTTIDLPDSVTAIGPEAFRGSGLKRFVVPPKVTSLGSGTSGTSRESKGDYDISYANFSGNIFEGCASLEEVVFHDKVTFISTGVFSGCTSLKSVVFPASIKTIYKNAFSGCSSLSSITFNGNVSGITLESDGWGSSYQVAAPVDFTADASIYVRNKNVKSPAGRITNLVIGPGVKKLDIKLNLPPMPLAEQAKLRELGIQSTHSGDEVPYKIEYR
jgi:hypothetical protein